MKIIKIFRPDRIAIEQEALSRQRGWGLPWISQFDPIWTACGDHQFILADQIKEEADVGSTVLYRQREEFEDGPSWHIKK